MGTQRNDLKKDIDGPGPEVDADTFKPLKKLLPGLRNTSCVRKRTVHVGFGIGYVKNAGLIVYTANFDSILNKSL